MKSINVTLAFRDREYSDAVAKALSETERYFNIAVGDSDCIHNSGSIIVQDFEPCSNHENTIFLDGFKSASEIASAIREKHMEMNGEPFRESLSCESRLIIVTGASGGSGITSVSEALAEEFYVYYSRRSCVISFSLFPGNHHETGNKNIRQLIYEIENERETGMKRNPGIEDYFYEDERGVYYPYYGAGINVLGTIAPEECRHFLEKVLLNGHFDCVICDVPPEQIYMLRDVLCDAEGLVLLEKVPEKEVRSKRLKHFLDILSEGRQQNVIEVVNIVTHESDADLSSDNLSISQERGEKVRAENMGKIYAEFDPDSFKNRHARIDGIFGLAIKSIAQKLAF